MLSCIRLDKLLLHLLPLQFNFEPDRKLYFQNICYPFYTLPRYVFTFNKALDTPLKSTPFSTTNIQDAGCVSKPRKDTVLGAYFIDARELRKLFDASLI